MDVQTSTTALMIEMFFTPLDLAIAATDGGDDFVRPEASTGTEGHQLSGSAARIVADLTERFSDPDANQSAPWNTVVRRQCLSIASGSRSHWLEIRGKSLRRYVSPAATLFL